MKPAPFAYHRPQTVADVVDVLARLDDAKLLAGGQSLMPMMNFRYVTPANVVDLIRVTELAGIAEDGDTLVIGAMTRQRVEDPALVRGEGRFVDDLRMDGVLHAAFVRSPHAHARIPAIDCDEARTMPGVHAVFTWHYLPPALRERTVPLLVPGAAIRHVALPHAPCPGEGGGFARRRVCGGGAGGGPLPR